MSTGAILMLALGTIGDRLATGDMNEDAGRVWRVTRDPQIFARAMVPGRAKGQSQ
ncbi:hypothetical protein [Pseudoroseicyclus sp. CXY001]|uniref:hypothetical protein n=1 Tax=Pseudoroseicyclus sp. CXY001 TaxID=3242492 RepID=UPI00358DD7D3